MKLAIVAAEFNRSIVGPMIANAAREAEAAGWQVEIVRVRGAYELPLPASALFARRDVDALVALAFIERGETQHGEVMGHVVHDALVRLSLEQGKPIGLAIIGPGATEEQAHARKDGYASAAVKAALDLHATMKALTKKKKKKR